VQRCKDSQVPQRPLYPSATAGGNRDGPACIGVTRKVYPAPPVAAASMLSKSGRAKSNQTNDVVKRQHCSAS
jgi:hypothetical protein